MENEISKKRIPKNIASLRSAEIVMKREATKARRRIEGIIFDRKGRTLEDEYGKEKAKSIIEKLRVSHLGLKQPQSQIDKRTQTVRSRGSQKLSNNPRWKGGVTPLRKLIYHMPEYQNWRKTIFNRDNYMCQYCGRKCIELNAHHKKEFSLIVEQNKISSVESAVGCTELWDIANGITLCIDCHRKTDSWGVKPNNG